MSTVALRRFFLPLQVSSEFQPQAEVNVWLELFDPIDTQRCFRYRLAAHLVGTLQDCAIEHVII